MMIIRVIMIKNNDDNNHLLQMKFKEMKFYSDNIDNNSLSFGNQNVG